MTRKLNCSLQSNLNSYEIEIKSGALTSQVEFLKPLASRFAIITSERIAEIYGYELLRYLSSNGLKVDLFFFPAGEKHKTPATKEILENQLFEKGCSRDTCVIALGGGVVTDLAGFLAATFCRGVPLVTIPTSLLGMVDASIGGKTGVNLSYGKNLVGAIYQPKKVIIDPAILKTLPAKELSNGIVEMIKHGLIADKKLFEMLEENHHKILNINSEVLEKVIFENCRIKKEIVEEDEKENGKRRLLNFGHTIGHALENLTKYSISHGEAVAIGILVESRIAVMLEYLEMNAFNRIHQILKHYYLPLKLPKKFPIQTLLDAMVLDKKSIGGRPRFVIIDAIGSACTFENSYCTHVDEEIVKRALEWMNNDLCSY